MSSSEWSTKGSERAVCSRLEKMDVSGVADFGLDLNNLLAICKGFPGDSDSKEFKESACQAGDPGSIPGSGRSPGEGNGNPLQYFCL